MSSCNSSPVNTPLNAEAMKTETIKVTAAESPVPPRIKDFTLRFDELIQKSGLHSKPVLNQQEINSWRIKEIDAFYDDQFKYHFLDTILSSSDQITVLIAREYDNENIIWLSKFDRGLNLIRATEVYYDNAEGNYLLESVFKNNTLTLYSDDVNEGKKTETLTIDSLFNRPPALD
jgi:hypothetical protein